MIQKELILLFPPTCYLKSGILLVSPPEFGKLEGRTLSGIRLFILVSQGSMSLEVGGRRYEVKAPAFLDVLDTARFRIKNFSPSLRAWACFITFDFASASLKNLRPGPQNYLLERLNIPVQELSEKECGILEQQLTLLRGCLADMKHFYRQELSQLYFKSFSLELGNVMLSHSEETDSFTPHVNKYDFLTLGFLKLVSKHFASQHTIDFYAESLCISVKHLTRVVKEKIGKTPHQIICNEIVHRAMEMLEDERISVGQIAEELHFSDQAAFSKFFKKQVKMAPMLYRQKYEKNSKIDF